jgi:hypothetical protein
MPSGASQQLRQDALALPDGDAPQVLAVKLD